MTIQSTLNYLYNLERLGIKLGLNVITDLLQLLNNPQNKFKSVHIAGTNGKGSVSAYLAAILQEAGYKVGWYTSPHLVRFNERIRVDGKAIEDGELVRLTELIKSIAEKNNLQPTFFEFTTALAFLYFAEQKVDFAVVEVGMGGRLDATNVLKPEVSVITNISFDHQKHLGDTLEKIAVEKAGIIKESGIVVVSEKDLGLIEIFKEKCDEKNSRLLIVNDELRIINKKEYETKQKFTVQGAVNGIFETKLLGEHQIENACTAILTAEVLGIERVVIKKGVEKARWPGRLEFISKNVLVDCAHNVAGMETLREFMLKQKNRKMLVLAIAEDKEIGKMVQLIVPLFKEVIITQSNYKPAETGRISIEVKKYVQKVREIPKVWDALNEALNLVSGKELVLITGSIYMVGDALIALSPELNVKRTIV